MNTDDLRSQDALSPYDAPEQTLLIVEDDNSIRLLLVEMLADLGYRIVETANAFEALQALEGEEPIHLMMTDIGMRGMNGMVLAETARQLRPGLPVLFITGHAHDGDIVNRQFGNGTEIIFKPFSIDALEEKVRTMLRR
ncbi:response regulator [Pseudomonas sp. RIT-PI-AD]|uniref:response regulator n=1 Tax=Pseudomonas sp. RIT-PI-AD TaxID=3035294 RepID=UPI0021D7F166|nr:response regulator [Pseudomonas sp. RIT-PI-AD]